MPSGVYKRKNPKIQRLCEICRKEFWTYIETIKKGYGRFCSHKCDGKHKEKQCKQICKQCKKVFYVQLHKAKRRKYCSQKCCGESMIGRKLPKETLKKMSQFMQGKQYGFKTGKYVNLQGYIMILKPKHPFRNSRNYIPEHRLVMEEHLGRYLTKEEVVHHRGTKYPMGSIKDKQDNRIENLKLFANNGKHITFHYKI